MESTHYTNLWKIAEKYFIKQLFIVVVNTIFVTTKPNDGTKHKKHKIPKREIMTQTKRNRKYWIIVASKDHVRTGLAEGIAQACHGKTSPLKRMRKDDFIIYYSGKQTFGKPDKCQEFTAIGKVMDDEVYQFQMSADFCPSRRNIEFLQSEDISIQPLIHELEFIRNKTSWGYPFRFGFFEINQHDFDLISSQMLQKVYA
ncbi:EVE domain-containing protein [Flavitalea flava]